MPCVKISIKRTGLFYAGGFLRFLHYHKLHIGDIHGSIALYVVDKHFIQYINHILVPLDSSRLAECVLPHVLAIAPVMNARVTLTHVWNIHITEMELLLLTP